MVIFISGTPAAGKSSVSKLLAAKFDTSTYINVDDLKDMIIGGNVAPWSPEGPKQFELVEKNFLSLISNFIEEDFVVIVDYVFGDDNIKRYQQIFTEVYGFLLLPDIETIKARELGRDPEGTLIHRIDALYPKFADVQHDVLNVIDSTNQSVEETVDEILSVLDKKD